MKSIVLTLHLLKITDDLLPDLNRCFSDHISHTSLPSPPLSRALPLVLHPLIFPSVCPLHQL